eukprot:7441714-Alexandrium_andersonii.AAC.1
MAPKLVEKALAEAARAEKQAKSASSRKASRHLDRRNTDEQVDRALAEHFPGCSQVFLTEVKVDGRSLRDEV